MSASRLIADQNPKKLFGILNKLYGFGNGRKVTRVNWKFNPAIPSYWTVSKVVPKEVALEHHVLRKPL